MNKLTKQLLVPVEMGLLILYSWLASLYVARRRVWAMAAERGGVQGSILTIIGGVITLVVGLVLFTTILTQATAAGSDPQIGSFSGAQALNDLVPLVYIAAIVIVGVGLIGLGGMAFKNNN